VRDAIEGLRKAPKTIPSKYFYDRRGSELFEEITGLEEYYPTRSERALLERWAPVWVAEIEPHGLVELGAGAADKTRLLLDAMVVLVPGAVFVPVDVSEAFLRSVAEGLREDYPGLEIRPHAADFTAPLDPAAHPPSPAVFALLGSTIGNFGPPDAVRILRQVRAIMEPEDVFLLGADLRPGPRKSVERLEAAYNDARGVTAEFNRNILRVLNRDLGTDFDVDAFRHTAFWEPGEGRIEMHLVAVGPQTVSLPDGSTVSFRDGESVRTEISTKYDRPGVEEMLGAAGMSLREWREDPGGLYALALADPA
jgi:L-histidine N-alpha-methyltransferase